MSTQKQISIGILCDESASLFKGGEKEERFGGAGLHMYLLGNALQKYPHYDVSFIFSAVDARGFEDDNVRFVSLCDRRDPVRYGLPLVSRRTNQDRLREPYRDMGPNRVFISTMAALAPLLEKEAAIAGAKTIFQTASETDVTGPRGFTLEEQQELLDSIARMDVVAVQTRTQQENLFGTRSRDSIVIRKGMPAPRDCPTQNTKQGILWVGSAQAPKQPWIFLDVARLLPSEQFTMILPPGEIALFEHIRREAPGIPNLTLIDRQLPYLETQPYFDRAEVFMYTTAFGTDPAITVLQAALGGCAIVSSRLDPDENMFTKHDTGIVCNDSSAEIAEAISRLRLDEARKEELAHNAFQYVKDTYDIATMTKQYSGLIDSLF